MPNKMLIDASHPEETRVVVVRGNRIEEFDFESQDKKQLKGNIYLARVTRVEPSLQAAFVEYGGNRHGFLAFSEIHPDYYQIPVADRQALLRAEAEDHRDDEDDEDGEERSSSRNNGRRRRRRGRSHTNDEQTASAENGDDQSNGDGDDTDAASDTNGAEDEDRNQSIAQAVDADVISEDVPSDEKRDDAENAVEAAAVEVAESSEPNGDDSHDGNADDSHADDDHGDDTSNDNGNGHGDDEVVSVGAEDALEEVREHRRRPQRRQYKIQEVIKRRQILLVQVVKEERGNKGAALTTYLSLAGRYSVLMPNTARGGGISRKITNAQDRKRLKDVVKDLEVPQGMGVILRTAGESRTKAEIKRDYEYLMRMWDNVRTLTLQSSAPALVYEEGSLIKRSVRDLYNKDIDEITVAGEEGYREAKDFMRMLMPSHAKVVQPYRDPVPMFARSGIEAQLDKMMQPQVTLKSGGYIIINQTEALVAIDVNSGRSTKEHSIEDTALQTNLEAAEEVARQLRLRDLAGLIVIDFIDMEENRNNRAVEKRLKDHLKNDRARIQVGRISHFGLLEMSRQRIRASVLESTTQICSHCGGTGHVRSESSVALLVVRAIEEFLLKESRNHITVRTPMSTAIYVLNNKRSKLVDLENRFGLTISIEADDSVHSQHYAIVKGALAEKPEGFVPLVAPVYEDEPEEDIVEIVDDEAETEAAAAATPQQQRSEEGDGQRKRRRRRRKRGGRDRDSDHENSAASGDEDGGDEDSADGAEDDDSAADADAAIASEGAATADEGEAKKRRRGKRGGKRNRRDDESTAGTDENGEAEAVAVVTDEAVMAVVEETPVEEAPAAETEAAPTVEEEPKKKPVRRTRKAKVAEPELAEAAAALDDPASADATVEAVAETVPAKPKRAPRRKAAAAVAEPALAVEATEEAPVEAQAEAAVTQPAEVEPAEVEPAEIQAPSKPAPAPAPSVPAEPVVTSSNPTGEDTEKPRKGGWWQRKGFF